MATWGLYAFLARFKASKRVVWRHGRWDLTWRAIQNANAYFLISFFVEHSVDIELVFFAAWAIDFSLRTHEAILERIWAGSIALLDQLFGTWRCPANSGGAADDLVHAELSSLQAHTALCLRVAIQIVFWLLATLLGGINTTIFKPAERKTCAAAFFEVEVGAAIIGRQTWVATTELRLWVSVCVLDR